MNDTSNEPTVLGYDIGGTQLRVALVRGATLLAERKVASGGMSPEEVALRAAQLATEVEREGNATADRAGVGVAAMLPKPATVVENAPNLGWIQVPFQRLLTDALGGRPVILVNDVDAAAYGEAAFGAGRGASELMCVFVGTGIGAGLVLQNTLYTGYRGVAAELGHIKVANADGRPCYCGQMGCLEAYAGGRALLERVQRDVDEGKATEIAARLGNTPLSLRMVDEAAADGDPYSDLLWQEASGYIGTALANVCTVLNPEVLILGGGVWFRCPDLQARVRAVIDAQVNTAARMGLRVVDAQLGDNAGILGAAKLAADRL